MLHLVTWTCGYDVEESQDTWRKVMFIKPLHVFIHERFCFSHTRTSFNFQQVRLNTNSMTLYSSRSSNVFFLRSFEWETPSGRITWFLKISLKFMMQVYKISRECSFHHISLIFIWPGSHFNLPLHHIVVIKIKSRGKSINDIILKYFAEYTLLRINNVASSTIVLFGWFCCQPFTCLHELTEKSKHGGRW